MADRSGTAAELEVATAPGAALTPMGQFAGRPDLPLNRAVTTIGSRETCRLQLDSRSISRVHAVVVSTQAGAYIADLCSRTGVLVNGRSIRDTNLASGDRIQLGKFTFRFRGWPPSPLAVSSDSPVMPSAPPLALQDGDTLIPVPGRALLIGRRENADLPLSNDPEVSTVHAVLFQMDGDWHVRDLASRTGTRVNGSPIDLQQRIEVGDTLEIGSAVLTLVPAPPQVSAADGEEDALPLDADLPLADLEPLDFSSIDSIEAGETDDDAVPTLPADQPAAVPAALDEVAPAASELEPHDEETLETLETLEVTPDVGPLAAIAPEVTADVNALELEPPATLAPPQVEPAQVEPGWQAESAESAQPTSELGALEFDLAEPVAEGGPTSAEVSDIVAEAQAATPPPPAAEINEPLADAASLATDSLQLDAGPGEAAAEVEELKPKRKRTKKPAGPKRDRLRRVPPEAGAEAADGAAVEGAATASVAPLDVVETAEQPVAAASEVPDTIEPLAQPALAFEASLADEPEASPAAAGEVTGGIVEPEAIAGGVTGDVVEPIVEAPVALSPGLELSELGADEEFVAVPELEHPEPVHAVPDTPPVIESVQTPPVAPEPAVQFDPLADEGVPATQAAEAVSLPIEPSSASDWLIDESDPSLPLTSTNTALAEAPAEPTAETGAEPAPQPASIDPGAAGLLTALPAAGLLLGEAAATTATAAGPGLFGFTFEGGSYLGGMLMPAATPTPPTPRAETPPPTPQPQQAHELQADAEIPALEVSPVAEPELLDDSLPDFDEPPQVAEPTSAPAPQPAPVAEQPATPVPPVPAVPPAPLPIQTLSDEVAVPPLATPARTPPRQRRPLTTAFDGLSNGAKITGFVGGVSVNGRSPAGRGGPSVDVFSQQIPIVAPDGLAEQAFADASTAGPALSRRSPPGSASAGAAPPASAAAGGEVSAADTSSAAPPPPAETPQAAASQQPSRSRAKPATRTKRRWPVWGLLLLMFLSLGAVWAAVYALVPLSSQVTGTLNFANLSEQNESAQVAFKSDQIARLHSNEVRTIARSILQNGGAPTGFTEDMISLGKALDRDGNVAFTGNTLTAVVKANDPTEGRAQMDALLTALAQRDADLGDTQHRAAQTLTDANAAVATARDHLDSLKAQLPMVRARGEDRPDAEELASLQSASDRAQRLMTLARSTRLNAEAELDLLRMPLPKPPAPADANGAGGSPSADDSPRDAQLTRLRWELGDLARQVNDLKVGRPDAAPAAPTATPGAAPAGTSDAAPAGDAVNDSLLAYLDAQVQALTTSLSDQATGVPGPAGEAVRLRQMDALSVRVHSLQQAEKTAQDNAQLAIDKLRSLQGRLDSARQATVEIDQLIADIRTAETTLRDKSDAATAAQQQASFAVAVAGDPSESVQPLSDHRPVYAGVLSGLVLCVFSGLAISALRHEPAPTAVEVLTGEDPAHVIGGGGFDMAADPDQEQAEEPVGVGHSDSA